MPDEILYCPAVLEEVFEERRRQHKKWGEQNHRDGTLKACSVDAANYAKAHCQEAFEGGWGDWEMILREEFFEAMAEADPVKLRAELIQVAAVAVAWAQAIDRRDRYGLVETTKGWAKP